MSHFRVFHVLTIASFAALLGLGCDPADAGKHESKAAGEVVGAVAADHAGHAKKGDPPAPVAVAAGAAGSTPATGEDVARLRRTLGEYESCDKSCFADSSAKETNIETCRLNCKSVAETAGAAPGSPAHRLMERFDVCLGECHDDKAAKDTDRETCKLNCAAVFDTLESDIKSGEGPAPSGVVPTACAEQCTAEVVRCQSACDESRAKETDKATCKLTCGQSSEVCLEKCKDPKRAAP